ncbi:LysR family transcriptional regulator [Phyllobacterium sp. 628]|uniref:LysR substrate-binding domain-containing protein n=1 Tax=Phyllobacterium sp. 628 TaxID=2718938 RepID=UPI001662335F|nr:LysR substrate-binding domain-containing protein [Phyllobacterium sp. 628]QND53641.1 LysR family transcriptional regulator [Phyllobacterium sp. 628]
MRQLTFDLDVLRTFITGVDMGNFAKAADRLGRSTSAVSAQLKKLEQQTGIPIFQKAGRGLVLTDAGETMLAYARRLIDLNDEAASAVHGIELEGWVRLGLQEDFGETLLPNILGQFARAHPKVRIEARVARNAELVDRVTSGKLDLALAWNTSAPPQNSQRVLDVPMCWVGSSSQNEVWELSSGEPLPLAALEAPCLLRTAATAALDKAGIPWRLAFISPSLGGLWAATAAGLGVTIRTPIGLPKSVRPIGREINGLPALPMLGLDLHRADAEPAPVTAKLAAIILQALQDILPADAKAA